MNDPRGHAPDRQVRRGIAVVLSALLVPPGTLLLRMVPALDLALRPAVGHPPVVSAISASALAVADVWDAFTCLLPLMGNNPRAGEGRPGCRTASGRSPSGPASRRPSSGG